MGTIHLLLNGGGGSGVPEGQWGTCGAVGYMWGSGVHVGQWGTCGPVGYMSSLLFIVGSELVAAMKCGNVMTTGLECLRKGYELADEQVALEAARQPTTRIKKAVLRKGDAAVTNTGV